MRKGQNERYAYACLAFHKLVISKQGKQTKTNATY